MSEITSCIHQVPIFRVLPEQSVERLKQVMDHGHFMPDEPVIHMGDPVTSLVVVARGMLKLSRINKSGREQIIRELGPGEFYGEMALFAPMEAEGDLIAVNETHACILERSAVQEELKNAPPQVAWPLVQAIAQRLSEAERTIGDLALLDVGERLAAELLRLAQNEDGTMQKEFEIPFAWAQLATKLGTTPESLSRRLKNLVKAGYVAVEGRHVTMRDPDGLHEMVHGL